MCMIWAAGYYFFHSIFMWFGIGAVAFHSGIGSACVVSLQHSAPVAYESVCIWFSFYSVARNVFVLCLLLAERYTYFCVVLFALWQRSLVACRSHEVRWGDGNEVIRAYVCARTCVRVSAYEPSYNKHQHMLIIKQPVRKSSMHTPKRTHRHILRAYNLIFNDYVSAYN